jgi:hypothetical protein
MYTFSDINSIAIRYGAYKKKKKKNRIKMTHIQILLLPYNKIRAVCQLKYCTQDYIQRYTSRQILFLLIKDKHQN